MLTQPGLAAGVVGFTAEALEHRVTALLGDPPAESTGARWLLAATLAALVVVAPVLHHAIGTVLSPLAR